MTSEYLADATQVIRRTICETMSTAAIASGMLSRVDYATSVADLMASHHGTHLTSRTWGLTSLREYLFANGLPSGIGFARAVREEVIRRDMVKGSKAL